MYPNQTHCSIDMDVAHILTQWISAFLHSTRQRLKSGPTTSSIMDSYKWWSPSGYQVGCSRFPGHDKRSEDQKPNSQIHG